jgi:hypothetical protein
LRVPPRIHFFLWLMTKNKMLTGDNLGKRRKLEDRTCLFCSENETIAHLFFGCVVARQAWTLISDVFHIQIGVDYESMAKHWLCNKKYGIINVFSSALCWGLWKLKNSMCFQGVAWLGMKLVWQTVIPMLRCWKILTPVKDLAGYEAALSSLEKMSWRPERIALSVPPAQQDGAQAGGRNGMLNVRSLHFEPP